MTDSHLYEFGVGRTARWGLPDPDWPDGRSDAAKAELAEVIEIAHGKAFTYLYDFGNGWAHTIKVESRFEAGAGIACLSQARRSQRPLPAPGRRRCLRICRLHRIVADPKHPRHVELVEWVGEPFDPNMVDVASIEHAFGRMAAYWTKPTKKPRTRRKPSKRTPS